MFVLVVLKSFLLLLPTYSIVRTSGVLYSSQEILGLKVLPVTLQPNLSLSSGAQM